MTGLLQKVCDVLKTRAELERKYGESLLSLGETIGPEPGRFESEQKSTEECFQESSPAGCCEETTGDSLRTFIKRILVEVC